MRAKICLLAHEGLGTSQIARQLNTSRPTVVLWRKRFTEAGVSGLEREPARRVGSRGLDEESVERIKHATENDLPPKAALWSTRGLARHLGLSHMTVSRVWNTFGLRPRRGGKSKHPINRTSDIVGVYLNPPERLLVVFLDKTVHLRWSGNKKSELSPKPDPDGERVPRYLIHGSTNLFAALRRLEPTVIGGCFERLRHEEFLRFLSRIDRGIFPNGDLHLIAAESPTHHHPKVQAWLRHRQGRFSVHLLPATASLRNLSRHWFRRLAGKRVRPGSFKSVKGLIEAIGKFTQQRNEDPKPFVWVRSQA